MSPRISIRLLASQSDQRLVALAGEGHERAFEALVQRYRRPLLRYCRRLRLGDARAEDVLQQAFLQAWLAFARGTDVRDVRPWLYRIVHNAAVNAMRGRRRGAQRADRGDAGRRCAGRRVEPAAHDGRARGARRRGRAAADAAAGDLPDGRRRAEPRRGGRRARHLRGRAARPALPRPHDAAQRRRRAHPATAACVGGRRRRARPRRRPNASPSCPPEAARRAWSACCSKVPSSPSPPAPWPRARPSSGQTQTVSGTRRIARPRRRRPGTPPARRRPRPRRRSRGRRRRCALGHQAGIRRRPARRTLARRARWRARRSRRSELRGDARGSGDGEHSAGSPSPQDRQAEERRR